MPLRRALCESAVINHCPGGISLPELIRKLETEKLLNRDDILALNLALNNSDRRDYLMRILEDIELGTSPRCAVRRLRMLMQQNSNGLPSLDVTTSCNMPTLQRDSLQSSMEQSISATSRKSGKSLTLPNLVRVSPTKCQSTKNHQQNPPLMDLPSSSNGTNSVIITPPVYNSFNDCNAIGSDRKRSCSSDSFATQFPVHEHTRRMTIDADRAISSVVGDRPVYSGRGCYGACIKIGHRLNEHNVDPIESSHKLRPVRFAVLVGSGSCNPLTRMHLRSYFLAKQFLENTAGYVVLGSILSPSHGVTVRERYRNHPTEVIPSPHRLAVAQLMVESSKWLSVDPWEITRRRPMDYLSLLQHCKHALTEGFPDVDIKMFYLCKDNMIPKISPIAMRDENFGCISVCRYTRYALSIDNTPYALHLLVLIRRVTVHFKSYFHEISSYL